MDNASLDSFPLPMDDPNLSKALLPAFQEVFFKEGRNLLGGKRVKIDPVFDRDGDNHRIGIEVLSGRIRRVKRFFGQRFFISPLRLTTRALRL